MSLARVTRHQLHQGADIFLTSLQLKSTEGQAGEAGGNAVLCTPTKTFNIRQKNSSNTVFILQSGVEAHASDNAIPGLELTAISKPESTLETLPVSKSIAAAQIRQILPVLATTGQASATRSALTKAQLLANVPFSDAECDNAFRELSTFSDVTTNHCMIPSAKLKIETWLSILENSRANAVDLTSELNSDAILSLKDGLEDLPAGLYEAVLSAFASKSNDLTTIDQDKVVRWVGLNRLEADAPKNAISVSAFKSSWKDGLPEKLREKVDLPLIADRHILSAGGKSIAFKDYALDLTPGAEGAGAQEGKSALGTKRKWHEKFKPAKKAT